MRYHCGLPRGPCSLPRGPCGSPRGSIAGCLEVCAGCLEVSSRVASRSQGTNFETKLFNFRFFLALPIEMSFTTPHYYPNMRFWVIDFFCGRIPLRTLTGKFSSFQCTLFDGDGRWCFLTADDFFDDLRPGDRLCRPLHGKLLHWCQLIFQPENMFCI